MTALPTTHTFSAGEVVTDTTLNNSVTAVLNFLMARPILKCRQTVAQSLANNTTVAVNFDAEDVDSSGMHSTVTNTSRGTAVYPGWYLVSGNASYAANATGSRINAWGVNGTIQAGGGTDFPAASATASNRLVAAAQLFFLNVNDYVELLAFQNSGGALNTAVTASEQSTMICVWVSS